MPPVRDRALVLLREALADPAADFRDGQLDAIEALVERRARLLVVQRTGWGKSAVYFLSAKLLREKGSGPALVVSPLLALMRDQLEAAKRMGVRAETVNSTNRDDWARINDALRRDGIDVLLVSPERLANEQFVAEVLLPMSARIGLFVIDEAHCISDWGHDFRPDYKRIIRVLNRLPAGVPVCATTATANDRVTADIQRQLGEGMETVRGALARPSVRLQTVPLKGDAEKLAWLAAWVPKLRKQSNCAGIVYALTQRWTERIADWLRKQAGMDARAYHADLSVEEKLDSERDLMENKLDCLVATTALGMGYDKRDLGFVVHFHQPGSVVHYYQQVGRAGRAIPTAYGVMLSGGDDRAITDWFIEEAFPPEGRIQEILGALERSKDGLNPRELEQACNLRRGQIERVLKILGTEEPAPVTLSDGKWRRTGAYDAAQRKALAEKMTGLRKAEQAQMDAYSRHTGCFMEFLAKALDDPHAGPCGSCAPCRGQPNAMRAVEAANAAEAGTFLRGGEIVLEPRKQWPVGAFSSWKGNIAAGLRTEEGRALCVRGDGGWGVAVAEAIEKGAFNAELADALTAMVKRWNPTVEWVACVPSLRSPMVDALARAVAHRLGLPFKRVLSKTRENRPQAEMENSFQQASNLDGVFAAEKCSGPVLLLDDVADSGWTLTVATAVLRQAGAGPVFPAVTASMR